MMSLCFLIWWHEKDEWRRAFEQWHHSSEASYVMAWLFALLPSATPLTVLLALWRVRYHIYQMKVANWCGHLCQFKLRRFCREMRVVHNCRRIWNITQHKTPSLNQCDCATKPTSYETFTIEGNFQPLTPTACAFLFITVGKLKPLFLDRHG